MLVYLGPLSMDDLVLEHHNLSLDFEDLNNVNCDKEKSVFQAGVLLYDAIESHPGYMSWPPKEEELKAENVSKFIPTLLNTFLKTLFHGRSKVEQESQRVFQRRNSIAQDIVYCVSKGRSRTPKSVLFPCVVKSL